MGCATSKFELKEEELPPGLKPIQRKLEDAKKRMRRRRYSIVSTTELLSQENVPSESSSGKAKPSTIVPEPIDEEQEISIELVKSEIKEDDQIKEIYGEMPPGSPSFRFYCTDLPEKNRSFDSTDSVKLPEFKRAEEMKETKEQSCETKATEESQDSTEGSEGKIVKKEKGRKLLSLPRTVKTPNAVQNLLTCYSFTTPAASNTSKTVSQ